MSSMVIVWGVCNIAPYLFETEIYDTANYQGNAVVNYTDRGVPYTRIIEHKHFEMFGQQLWIVRKL